VGVTEESKALMWRITDEIWNNGRLDLIDELIAGLSRWSTEDRG
jgi:hypothetical protein